MGFFKRILFTLLSWLLPERLALRLIGRRAAALRRAWEGVLTDKFLEILLGGMEVGFVLSRGFRKNLRGFSGTYLFCTSDGTVAAGARFARGRMRVVTEAFPGSSVSVSFRDAGAMRRFLMSRDQDILASILANEVAVDGNLNYLYKFAFLARDLLRRLGVA